LIVGRYLGATALGVYMLGFQIPRLVIKQFYSALSEVIFPVFSRMREESSHLGEGFLNTIRYTSILTVPMAVGLSLVADPLVRTLFGDKWLDAIPITAAIAIYTLIGSLYFASGDVFKAQGRPEIVTRLHIFNLIVLIPALYWAAAIQGSLVAVGWMQVAVVLLVGAVRTVVAGRLLHFSMFDFIKVLMPTLIASAIMAVAVQGVMTVTFDAAPIIRLIAGIVAGGLSYTLAILWLQRDLIVQAQKTIRGVFARV
jgi:PST family polysaccharide transporter